MSSTQNQDADAVRQHRRLNTAIKKSLRELGNQLSLLNHQVGARVELKDVDLDCLDLIARHGPLSPSALSRQAGLHPATMTGILDRLERDGWVVRDRDPVDRRAVLVRVQPKRMAELVGHYAGMNGRMDEICASYGTGELAAIADFLRRTAEAGQVAADELAEE
jgi:DNA-binding MarR family transcriptional regulator